MALCLFVRPSVCLSVFLSQVGVLSKRMDESGWFLAWKLPLLWLHTTFYHGLIRRALGLPGGSGGHTGGASCAVHQGPRPLGAHQRGPDSNLKKK